MPDDVVRLDDAVQLLEHVAILSVRQVNDRLLLLIIVEIYLQVVHTPTFIVEVQRLSITAQVLPLLTTVQRWNRRARHLLPRLDADQLIDIADWD